MSFTITEVAVRCGDEVGRESLHRVFDTRSEAWQFACALASKAHDWGTRETMDVVWVRQHGTEFRYYIHQPGSAPARIVGGVSTDKVEVPPGS